MRSAVPHRVSDLRCRRLRQGRRDCRTATGGVRESPRVPCDRSIALRDPGKRRTQWLEEGTAIDATVFRDDEGQRFLDAKVSWAARFPSVFTWPPWPTTYRRPARDTVGIRLCTTAVRVVEPVKLGEKIAVPLNGEGKHRVELRVSEVAAPEAKRAPTAEPNYVSSLAASRRESSCRKRKKRAWHRAAVDHIAADGRVYGSCTPLRAFVPKPVSGDIIAVLGLLEIH